MDPGQRQLLMLRALTAKQKLECTLHDQTAVEEVKQPLTCCCRHAVAQVCYHSTAHMNKPSTMVVIFSATPSWPPFVNSCHAQRELWFCLCTPHCMQDLPASYVGMRLGAWSQLQAASAQLQPSAAGLPYTAIFLLDQAAAAGLLTQPGATASPSSTLQPAWAAAALLVADEAMRLQVAPGAPSAAPAPALSEVVVAGHFEVSTEALQAAVVTLREACGQACLAPITPYMMLELYIKVLSAGCMEYQVCAG